ncbi:MAG: hypothetical protein HY319_25120 [Armatimonadetes bacterium]|nr:hypothetical protein [Armatimonadota bacterium]
MRVHSLSIPASASQAPPAPRPDSAESRYREAADRYQSQIDELQPQLAELTRRRDLGHRVALRSIVGLCAGFGVMVAGTLAGGGPNLITSAVSLPLVAGSLGCFAWGIWTRDNADMEGWFKRSDLDGLKQIRDHCLEGSAREHRIDEVRSKLGEPVTGGAANESQ